LSIGGAAPGEIDRVAFTEWLQRQVTPSYKGTIYARTPRSDPPGPRWWGLLCPLGYAWFDKAKPCGERSRTILPGQDWELEIRNVQYK